MPRNRSTRRALIASLSSVAAAGLASADRGAEAGIVEIDVNKTVGFGSSDLTSYTVSLPHGQNILFYTQTGSNNGVKNRDVAVSNVPVGAHGSLLSRVGVGKTYSQVGTHHTSDRNALYGVSNGAVSFRGNNTDQIYSAFSFNNNGVTDYGWLSGTLDTSYATLAFTIDKIVYDDSGAKIETGQMPTSAVPEPTSIGLMMMGAIAIGGASAVRRWKAGKAAASA